MASLSERVSWSMLLADEVIRDRQGVDIALVHAHDLSVRRWIEHELFGEPVAIHVVGSVVDPAAPIGATAPRFLIADIASLSIDDLSVLTAIRDAGWAGVMIAIGEPSQMMERALGIDRVLPRTLALELLRTTMREVSGSALRS